MSEKTKWRDLSLFLIGQGISSMGTLIQKYCISLYILNVTGSSSLFSILIVLSTIPSVVIGPIGGVFGDRMSKRKMMIYLDFFSSSILLLSLMIIGVGGSQSKMLVSCASVIILSIISAIYIPSANTVIPMLASKDDLMKANSINTFVITMSNIFAPILAGVLSAKFDIITIMIFNCVSFFISAIIEIIMRINEDDLNKNKNKMRPFEDFKEGLTSIKKNNVVISIIICSSACNFLIMPIYTVGVPYIVKVICKFSDLQYGWIEASIMIGMIFGAVITGAFVKKIRLKYVLGGAISGVGIGMMLLATLLLAIDMKKVVVGTGAFLSFVSIFMVVGSVISVMSVSLTTLLQNFVKKEVYARTSAIVISLSTAAIPLGQAVLGGVLEIIYCPVLLYVMTVALLLIGIYYMKQKKFDS